MAGKLKYNLEAFQQAAIKYRSELLMLPIIGINDTLKFMTGRPGIRYKERVGEISGNAQFAPYNPKRSTDFDLDLKMRDLETFFGDVVAKFEPNSAVSTLLGTGATKGDGQMQAPTARRVLALIAKSLSENLNLAIWKAKRDPSGNTSMDLFDGFDTITQQEINAGKISAESGNYLKINKKITAANAVDVAKKIMFSLDPVLRSQKCYLYCSQNFLDLYNLGYLMTHGATPYNNKYDQTVVEGSNGNLIFCPLQNKDGSNFFHVSPKTNMLVGYDQMGDVENITVKEFEAFLLSYIATMFFGVQFESIDKRRLKVVEFTEMEDPASDEDQQIIIDDDNDGGDNDGGDNDGGDNGGDQPQE